jgi:hypothetical protein
MGNMFQLLISFSPSLPLLSLSLSLSCRYEACWKAIMHEADGVILVFNPDTRGSDQLLNDWFDFFVKKNGLREEQAMIFAHRSNPISEKIKPRKFYSVYNLNSVQIYLFIYFLSISCSSIVFTCVCIDHNTTKWS